MKIFILLLSFLFVLLPVAASADVPKLDLRTLDGKSRDLTDYAGKGKWVLVKFWGVDCPICDEQKPSISKFHTDHKNRNAVVVGVNIDGSNKIGEIRESLALKPLSFPTLVGDLGVIALNYRVAAQEDFMGVPTYWLFNPGGELVGVNPGPLRVEAIEAFMAR